MHPIARNSELPEAPDGCVEQLRTSAYVDVAFANVLNVINSNVVFPGGSLNSIYINIGGAWTGKIFSLPSGMRLINDGNRLIIENDNIR